MKITKLLGLVVILVSFNAAANFKLPEYEKYTLENGLQVYLMQQSEVPLIDIRLTFKAGAINDGQNLGLANLTGESLMFGAGKLSKTEIEDMLAFHGAKLWSSSGKESSSIGMSIASQDEEKMMTLLRDLVLAPKFDQTEFTKYKKRMVNQLTQERESPRNVIGDIFAKMHYGAHPYGNPVNGDINSVKKLTLKAVKSFHQDYYTPQNAALIIVGDFETSAMKKQIAKLFANWKGEAPKEMVLPMVQNGEQAEVWIINKEDATETTFMIGGMGINADHPEYVSAQVINTILGGRFTSWLNDALRVNSGLTYGARSRFDANSTAGDFAISTFTKNATTFEAIDLALATYQKLWEKGIDAETLASAKAYMKGQFPPRYETGSQLANLLSRNWALGLSDSLINDFEVKVDSLDVKEANRISNLLFPKDKLHFILIGKASEIKEKAAKYGKVKVMDIKDFTF